MGEGGRYQVEVSATVAVEQAVSSDGLGLVMGQRSGGR